MNWAEVLTIIISIGTIMGGIVMWLDARHREDSVRHREDLKINEAHWREMFMYMSDRLDKVGKN